MSKTRGPQITEGMLRMVLDPTHATLKRAGAWLVLDQGQWAVIIGGGAVGHETYVITPAMVRELSVTEMDRTISHDETASRLNKMFPNTTTEGNGS